MSSCIEDFELGVTLGTGSFGRVRFCTQISSNNHYAIKILKKKGIVENRQVEHIKSEKQIMQTISLHQHPFIVNLVSCFQDSTKIYMVLEYVPGGEFFSYLRNADCFDVKTAQFYAACVVEVFSYLHAMDVIYRDLKPENILLERDGYVKVTDFGFAKKIEFKTYTLCGTPEYIAPEVLLNVGHGKGVDWWTLGILLYEMLAGEPPFVDDNPMGIYEKILSSNSCLHFPKKFDKHAKSLTKKLLTVDLSSRCGCSNGGAEDVKTHIFFAGLDWRKLIQKSLEPPIKPKVEGLQDTSNYQEYPESFEDNRTLEFHSKDLFSDF